MKDCTVKRSNVNMFIGLLQIKSYATYLDTTVILCMDPKCGAAVLRVLTDAL